MCDRRAQLGASRAPGGLEGLAVTGTPNPRLGRRPPLVPWEEYRVGGLSSSSELGLGARGSSWGQPGSIPAAGSNWFGQGAAQAGCIPGLRLAACLTISPRSGGPGQGAGAWAQYTERPGDFYKFSSLCLKSLFWPPMGSLANARRKRELPK